MEYFKFLPLEIVVDILSRLPTELVLECKLVCTNWRSLVRHPLFSKTHLYHLNHSSAADAGELLGFIAVTWPIDITKPENSITRCHYFEYDEKHESTTPIERIRRIKFTPPFKLYKTLGSCNGLICLSRISRVKLDICMFVCNPITKEYVVLPKIKSSGCKTHYQWSITSGFGYVSSTDEYKVVVIFVFDGRFMEAEIYTLGSGDGWRNLGMITSEFKPRLGDQAEAVFSNGALYWMDTEFERIISFDLAEEIFCGHLAPPPLSIVDDWVKHRIGMLDGFLFFSVWGRVERAVSYEIWLLKRRNDNHDMKEQEKHQSLVWSKEFSINDSKFFAVTKSDRVLTYARDYLFINDTKASTSERLDLKEPVWDVIPHKNTFISLKELGEEDTQTMAV